MSLLYDNACRLLQQFVTKYKRLNLNSHFSIPDYYFFYSFYNWNELHSFDHLHLSCLCGQGQMEHYLNCMNELKYWICKICNEIQLCHSAHELHFKMVTIFSVLKYKLMDEMMSLCCYKIPSTFKLLPQGLWGWEGCSAKFLFISIDWHLHKDLQTKAE